VTGFGAPDFALKWRPDIFVDELVALAGLDEDYVTNLLTEAFTGPVARERWQHACSTGRGELQNQFIADVQAAVASGDLAIYQRRPLWSQRNQTPRDRTPLTVDELRAAYAKLVQQLQNDGYFDQNSSSCPDDRDSPDLDEVLWNELGFHPTPWELRIPELDDAEFYDLVEVLHDHAARPRAWHYHSFYGHYDYSHFGVVTGQRLYRWKVNELFARSVIDLRLADSGEDQGRLVTSSHDAREDLVTRVRDVAPPRLSVIDHAVAQFRSRDADVHTKRSAIVALHRLIEERRTMLNTELLSADEGALFQIANEFNLRHSTDPGSRRKPQRTDYDPIFLDWVFWWCLATIELIDRLDQRQQH